MTRKYKNVFFCLALILFNQADSTPPPGHVPTPDHDPHPPKYEYGYVVSNGDASQGHMETRDGIYALGRYHVTLPGGSDQKVSYFADDWGYHPLVSYSSSTEHGGSRTQFAMGNHAVEALHNNHHGSPVAALISTSATQPISVSAVSKPVEITNTPTQVAVEVPSQEVINTVSTPTQVRVEVSNYGDSGHYDKGSFTSTTTVIPPTTQQSPTSILSTSEVPLTSVLPNSVTSAPVANILTVASINGGEKRDEENTQSQIQEAQIIQQELQSHIQNTINKLEQAAIEQVNNEKQAIIEQTNAQSLQEEKQQIQFDIHNTIQQHVENQQDIQEEISNKIEENTQAQINALERQQIEQQQLQNQIRLSAQQGIQQQFQSLREPTYHIQPFTFPFQHFSPSFTPAVQYVSAKAEQAISVLPHDRIPYSSHSALGSVLSQDKQSNVEIVTPSPIFFQNTSPGVLENNLAIKGTEKNGAIAVEGQNVQITSYLADTNKVLHFGDKLPSRDRQQDEQLLNEIEKHAKQRIAEDLRKQSIETTFTKPIVVTPTLASTPSGPFGLNLLNTGSYKTGLDIERPAVQPSAVGYSPTGPPLINQGYLESNSLSHAVAEKSDLSQTHVGVIGTAYGFSGRPYVSVDQLAPLQAGLALLSAPEKNSAPVSEESKEDFSLNAVGQVQALGYENRLVDSRAQEVVKEQDPSLQALKATNLAQQQENELSALQDNLKNLQQKILDDIDAQHEEEQRKQEVVAFERKKHLESLEKVAELIQTAQVKPEDDSKKPTDSGVFQGPEYLPPLSTESIQHQPVLATSYQDVSISSSGQNIRTSSHQEINVHGVSSPSGPPKVIEIEKPVIVEKPVAIETTKVVEIEKPVIVKETLPLETTKVVEVEKTIPILQPYPVPLTRFLALERPYGVPQPWPIPIPIPHPISVPIPQILSFPEILSIPLKQYHPVYIHSKTKVLKNNIDTKSSKRIPDQVFKEPRPELFRSSHSYHTIPLSLKIKPHKTSYYRPNSKVHPLNGRSKNSLKNLRIEYGFKPPLIPSTELTEEPKPSPFGPSVKE